MLDRKILVTLYIGILYALCGGVGFVAHADTLDSESYSLEQSSLSGGFDGGADSASYNLTGTVGEPFTGSAEGGAFQGGSGFYSDPEAGGGDGGDGGEEQGSGGTSGGSRIAINTILDPIAMPLEYVSQVLDQVALIIALSMPQEQSLQITEQLSQPVNAGFLEHAYLFNNERFRDISLTSLLLLALALGLLLGLLVLRRKTNKYRV